MNSLNIMIVGVGGQGTLLASRILGAAFLAEGMDVKVSEVHGMSQRGGSVVTYVRAADKVASPILDKGDADVILAFEQLEAARWLPYLKPDGKIIFSDQRLDPMPVLTGAAKYPEGIAEKLPALADATAVPALGLAEQAGSSKAVNVVLIGAMVKRLGLDKAIFIKALEQTVPTRFLEMNYKAFELGYETIDN